MWVDEGEVELSECFEGEYVANVSESVYCWLEFCDEFVNVLVPFECFVDVDAE